MSADTAGARVLVVDDEPQILRALGANLKARGYTVDLAATGEDALVHASDHAPDLVVLDLGLPGITGIEVIEGLRGWTAVPIVVLSARDAERDKIDALDAGADDYVTKPFGMGELLARIRAALRRDLAGADAPVVTTADFVVDLATKRVVRDGEDVRLTPTEWGLVEALVRNAGKLVGPTSAAPTGVGTRVRERDELPARAHGPHPAEARARPESTALLHHRAGHGLPLRSGRCDGPFWVGLTCFTPPHRPQCAFHVCASPSS